MVFNVQSKAGPRSGFEVLAWCRRTSWELNTSSALRDKQQVKPTLRDLQSKSVPTTSPHSIPAFASEPPAPPHDPHPGPGAAVLDVSATPAEVTLTDVFVPLESIKPSETTDGFLFVLSWTSR